MARAPYELKKHKYLSEPELAQLRATIERNSGDRDAVLLWLLLATGARVMEVLNIRPSDLDHAKGTVFITGSKGSKDREMPVHPDLFAALVREAAGGLKSRVFNISYTRARQIWDLYRPVAKKLHCLRHTFAIELYKKHRDLRLVQVALGHRNIQNTMIYADYIYSQEEMRRLIL